MMMASVTERFEKVGDYLKEAVVSASGVADGSALPDVDPWPRRLLLVGVVLMAAGLGAYASGWKDIEAASDPTLTNLAVVSSDSIEVELIEGRTYTALGERLDGVEEKSEVRLVQLSNGATNEGIEPDWKTPARSDSNNTIYDPILSWEISESGPHLIEYESGPAAHIYLVDESMDDRAALSSPTFLLGCLTCLAGFGLLPLAALVRMLNRRSEPVKLMVDNKGGIIIADEALSSEERGSIEDELEEAIGLVEQADLTPYLTPGRIPTTAELWQAQQASMADAAAGEIDTSQAEADREAIERFDSGIAAPFADRPDNPVVRGIKKRSIVPSKSSDAEQTSGDWSSWDEG